MYRVIVADPPWSFGDRLQMSGVKRGAESNYSTLTTRVGNQSPQTPGIDIRHWRPDFGSNLSHDVGEENRG